MTTEERLSHLKNIEILVNQNLEETKLLVADLKETYDFLEYTEAMTIDPTTSRKIREFLIKKGVWKKRE